MMATTSIEDVFRSIVVGKVKYAPHDIFILLIYKILLIMKILQVGNADENPN